MIKFLRTLLLIIFLISAAISLLFIVLNFYYEIFGFPKTQELLQKIHFPFNYYQMIIIGCASIAIAVVTYCLREALSKKLQFHNISKQ